MTKKIIKQEQGRSMVEMLGTLAIIGVLSVGGIAGYTYGMNKYYANELLAGASARAVIVASQLASGREPSLTEFAKMETAGGEFDNENIAKFSDGFGIKVSKVKKSVCENLIKDTEGTNIGIETEAGGEVTCGDENTFFITFDSLGSYSTRKTLENAISEGCGEDWEIEDCPEGIATIYEAGSELITYCGEARNQNYSDCPPELVQQIEDIIRSKGDTRTCALIKIANAEQTVICGDYY